MKAAEKRFDRVAGVALLVGTVALRMAVILSDTAPFAHDVDGYRALAENLSAHCVLGAGDVPTAFRPPLYPVVLSGLARLGLLNTQGLAVLHVALGTTTVWLSLSLGRRWGLGRWRFVAGALVACDPILLRQSTLVMSETMATTLAAAALVALSALVARPTTLRAIGAGVVLGLSVLCRPVFMLFLITAPLALVWLLPRASGWRVRLREGAVVLAAAVAILAPWGVRNAIRFGRPVITTTHGGFTLLLANNPHFYRHMRRSPLEPWDSERFNREVETSRLGATESGELAHDRREYAEAWQNIRAVPAQFMSAVAYRELRLWGVYPMPLPHESWAAEKLRYLIGFCYAAEFALAFAGLWSLGRKTVTSSWLFGLLLAACFSTVHALYWTDLRMRAPLVPAIACFAAAGVGWICVKFLRRKAIDGNGLQSAVGG